MSIVSANNTVKIRIGNFDIFNSKSEKPLGVKLIINSFSMIKSQNYVNKLVEKFMHYQE